jgi:hypothetical protein
MKITHRNARFQNTDRPCFGQNTGCVLNIRVLCFGSPQMKTTACAKAQNTNRNLSKINLCFGIPPLISIGCSKTQNTDFLTLRGRCSPHLTREKHHLPRANLLMPNLVCAEKPDPSLYPTTATRSAKNMIAVVFRPSHPTRKGDHPWLT